MIEVIDDFLSPSYFQSLNEMVCSVLFPWYYRGDVTRSKGENKDRLGSVGFDYNLIDNEDGSLRNSVEAQLTCACLYLIKDYIGAFNVLKGRYDMTVYNPEKFCHDPHVDLFYPPSVSFVSTILYMNESDGETLIFDEKCYYGDDIDVCKNYTVKRAVEPKPNRLLIFDGHHIHTGHSPSRHKNRILLNSVYGKQLDHE